MEPREIARCMICFKVLHDNQRLILDHGLTYCSQDCWGHSRQRIVHLHPEARPPSPLRLGIRG